MKTISNCKIIAGGKGTAELPDRGSGGGRPLPKAGMALHTEDRPMKMGSGGKAGGASKGGGGGY